MSSLNINTSLERLMKVISLSNKILSLHQKELKLKEQLSKLKDIQTLLLTKRSLLKETCFDYLISNSPSNDMIFMETDRKDVVCLLEKENFQLKADLKRTIEMKSKKIKDFLREFNQEDCLQSDIDSIFFDIINEYNSNIDDDE